MREEQTSHVIEKPDRTEVITGGVRTLFQGQNRSAAGQIAMLHQIIRQLQLEQSRQINHFLEWLDGQGIGLRMNGWPVILMSLETREKLVSQFVQGES